MNLTTVILRGHLGRRFGTRRTLAVSSPAEAIQALCATVPGFEQAVRESTCGYKILVRGQAIDPEAELHDPSGQGEIRIVPVVKGADSSLEKIVGGALLMVLSYYSFGTVLALEAGAPLAGATMFNTWVGTMGFSLALGGVTQLLAGTPSALGGSADERSYLFNSARNTSAQGNPVPCAYGEFYVTPPLISAGIETQVFGAAMFSGAFDGLGNWAGNGDTTPWGASLEAK